MKRKYVLLAFLVSCLLVTLFIGIVTSENVYNPLADVDQDGDVDVGDQRKQQLAMFTYGTPVNITELVAKVDSLNASLVQYQNRLEALETGGYVGAPAYDSGWQNISKGTNIILTHNANTTDVLVYMIGKYDGASPYIHQIFYGGDGNVANIYGAYWKDLTTTTITVSRMAQDNVWNYVRVMIWKVLP